MFPVGSPKCVTSNHVYFAQPERELGVILRHWCFERWFKVLLCGRQAGGRDSLPGT